VKEFRRYGKNSQPGMKWCPRCKTHKPIADFGKAASRYDGMRPYCNPCMQETRAAQYQKHKDKRAAYGQAYYQLPETKARHLRMRLSRYGLTLEEYQLLLEKQEGRCAICRTDQFGRREICIDHCHETGRVRGLLCHRCNAAIGHFQERLDLVQAAVVYLSAA
jgi:hypothetical protein